MFREIKENMRFAQRNGCTLWSETFVDNMRVPGLRHSHDWSMSNEVRVGKHEGVESKCVLDFIVRQILAAERIRLFEAVKVTKIDVI